MTTEDPTLLMSWVVLTGWGSLGLLDIPPSRSDNPSKRRILCGSILRLVAWILAGTAASRDSARYQWIVAPLVTTGLSSVAMLSMFPGYPAEVIEPAAPAVQ